MAGLVVRIKVVWTVTEYDGAVRGYLFPAGPNVNLDSLRPPCPTPGRASVNQHQPKHQHEPNAHLFLGTLTQASARLVFLELSLVLDLVFFPRILEFTEVRHFQNE